MKPVDYMAVAETAMTQIKKGAFLTVQAGEARNTMTIGWATVGFVWNKPVFMVAVRDSRHTFGLMEKAEDFTVSVPSGEMKDALMFCGTKSGRDMDKFAEAGLKTADARLVSSPVIQTPGIHFECRIIFKTAMDPGHVHSSIDPLYPKKDYHTLYFGEILDCYETS